MGPTTVVLTSAPVGRVHENKHWFSRIWLMLFNLLWLLSGLASVVLGVLLIQYSQGQTPNKFFTADQAAQLDADVSNLVSRTHVDVKTLGIIFTVYGCFMLLTAGAGLVGACNRNTRVLNCYIGTVSLCVTLTLACFIYFMVVLAARQKDWDSMTTSSWSSLADQDKDYYQWVFGCCGYDQNDQLAYTGSTRFWDGEPTVNPCPSTDRPGCHNAAHDFWKLRLIGSGVSGAIVLIILFATINAAYHAKKLYYYDSATQPMIVGAGYKQ